MATNEGPQEHHTPRWNPNCILRLDSLVGICTGLDFCRYVVHRNVSDGCLMAGKTLSPEMAKQVLAIYRANGDKASRVAEEMGTTHSTALSRIKRAKQLYGEGVLSTFEPVKLPEVDLPIEDLIAYRKKVFTQRDVAEAARKLIKIKIKLDGPIGIVHFGDPHVDDDGCDIAKLERDLVITRTTPGLYGANLGDLQNNWVGRLARLWADQSTSASQAWKLVQWMVESVDWIYIISGNHDCLDMETEALTQRGWKKYHDILENDLIYSLDIKTGLGRWYPILGFINRPHDGEMVSVEARGLSMLMTQNHRVLSTSRHWETKEHGKIQIYTAGKLPNKPRVPVSGHTETGMCHLSDDAIRFAAWVLTDGHISSPKTGHRVYSIFQSKDGAKIEAVLKALKLEYTKSTRHRKIEAINGRKLVKEPLPQTEYCISAKSARKAIQIIASKRSLPYWVNLLDDTQFEVFLRSLMDGDGSWASNGCESAGVLYGKLEFLESIQILCHQHGWRAHLSVFRDAEWRLNISKGEFIEFNKIERVKTSNYVGDVWCLTVPLGNFMVRRNGKVHFTGNCWSGTGDPVKWMMKTQPGLYEAHGARVGLQFPNGKQVRINARHDFRGHSMWNPAHGPMKAIQGGWRDHILTAGHKHTSFIGGPMKDPSNGLLSWAIRCAGYKIHDNYAAQEGFPDQNAFPACVTIIDPQYEDSDPRLVTIIPDVAEGAEFLAFKRKKAKV